MDTEGRQGNIAVTKKLELEEGNIITAKNKQDKGHIIIAKNEKYVQDIEKNIAKDVRDNEELDNTIKRIIEMGIEEKDNIIDMLSDMIMEGTEIIVKLLNTFRAATAPKSRAEPMPTSCGSGECYPTGVFAPRGEDKGRVALEAETLSTSETKDKHDCDLLPNTTEPTRARRMRE